MKCSELTIAATGKVISVNWPISLIASDSVCLLEKTPRPFLVKSIFVMLAVVFSF